MPTNFTNVFFVVFVFVCLFIYLFLVLGIFFVFHLESFRVTWREM